MSRRISLHVVSHCLCSCVLSWLLWIGAAIAEPTSVILISLDGTRPADIRRETLPSLVALAARGAMAEGLMPATPSNTFPSHVTLVTGVEPDRHGIVNNYFVDPVRGAFEKKAIPSWIEVEPLWSLLSAHGIVSASYHWVGSEGNWRTGRGPKYWQPFVSSSSKSNSKPSKVETILSWLDLEDPAQRPRFITSWFPGADHAAHQSGPGSRAASEQLARQEPDLRRLIDGIEARGLWGSTTLIIVSDHGMAPADRLLDFDLVLHDAGVSARVTGTGGFASVYFLPTRDRTPNSRTPSANSEVNPREQAEPTLDSEGVRAPSHPEPDDPAATLVSLAQSAGIEAIRVASGKAPFSNPRFGDFVLRAPIGVAIHRPGLPAGGFHGYASNEPEMHGVFIAAGRRVVPGSNLAVLHAIDIAPTVLDLLDVEIPEWMSGKVIALDDSRMRE